MKLSAIEWKIAAQVMAHGPISVFAIAKALGLKYTLAKRGARSLGKRNIIQRTAGGLLFQADAKAWGPGSKGVLVRLPRQTGEPSKIRIVPSPPAANEEEETLAPPPPHDDYQEYRWAR